MAARGSAPLDRDIALAERKGERLGHRYGDISARPRSLGASPRFKNLGYRLTTTVAETIDITALRAEVAALDELAGPRDARGA